MRISMLSMLLLFTSLLSGTNTDPQVSAGTLTIIRSFPSDYVAARDVFIWLPTQYDSTRAYPVLYMHDGQMLFDSTTTWNGQEWQVDETVQKLIDEQAIPTCIVVGVANVARDRHRDYFPEKPFHALAPGVKDSLFSLMRNEAPLLAGQPNADNYLKFLVNELKPYIDQHFATLPTASHTFIAGSSMGGLISMYAFFEYPEVFGGAACLSTHWIGSFTQNESIPAAFQQYLQARRLLLRGRRLYFDHGTTTLDQYYGPHQVAVDQIFVPLQEDPDYHYASEVFVGAPHTEQAWATRLAIPLRFLLASRQ